MASRVPLSGIQVAVLATCLGHETWITVTAQAWRCMQWVSLI